MSGRCLQGGWKVSEKCSEDVWMVSEWYLEGVMEASESCLESVCERSSGDNSILDIQNLNFRKSYNVFQRTQFFKTALSIHLGDLSFSGMANYF